MRRPCYKTDSADKVHRAIRGPNNGNGRRMPPGIKPIVKIITFALSVMLFQSCVSKKNELQLVKFGGLAQGTTYAVTYYDSAGANYHADIDTILKNIDQSLSWYQPHSVLSRVNRNDTSVIPDRYFLNMLNKSLEISEMTNGAFDVTVAPLVIAWGFGLSNRERMTKKIIDSLLQLVHYRYVAFDGKKIIKRYPGVKIDFNAIAQGYTVDLISEFLEAKGIQNYLVELGGEVRGKGRKMNGELWNIGIEKPADSARMVHRMIQAILRLENRSVATSGSYRKFYIENGIRYSHTIDPSTGYPVRHSTLSVTVVAATCTDADAYATALMVMGMEEGKKFLSKHPELQAYFLYSDSAEGLKSYMTDGLKDLISE